MKLPPLIGWSLLLLLTHAAVFLAARPGRPSGVEPVGKVMEGSEALPAGKSSDRQRPQSSSVHAGLFAELNASNLEGEDYDKAFAAIFREWMKRDLRGAIVFALGPEAGDRAESMASKCKDELQREIAAQAVQVGQWISGGYFGSRHAEVAALWVEALVAAGQGREIAVEALPRLAGPSRVEVIDILCQTAKGPELAELRRWMVPDEQGWLDDYAKRVVRFTGDDPAKIFAGEDSPEVTEELCKAYRERYIDSMPAREAVAASLKLPESYRGQLLQDIAGRDTGGLAAFTGMLAEMDGLSLWDGVSAESEATMIDTAIEAHCSGYSLPAETFAELCGILREGTRLAALRKAGDMIDSPDGEALADAVEALPEGKERDAFIGGLWDYGLNFGEETGARVLACVSDPDLRENLKGAVPEDRPREDDEAILPPPPAE